MNDLKHTDELLDPEKGFLTFEELKRENGQAYWLASELMKRLGYDIRSRSFFNAIKRTSNAIFALNIDALDNINKVTHEVDGKPFDDYKLSRFASYILVMNANPKKPEVAKAQAYFVAMTHQMEMLMNDPEQVARVGYREEVKTGQVTLSGVAKQAGVENYAKFHNAGYVGMYNMMNVELARKRGIDKNELLDHMGRAELAANLFRIEMTREKIKNEGIHGQEKLESTHRRVGKKVRDMVKESTGNYPEDLPVERRLPEVRGQIKKDYKKMLEHAPETQEKPKKKRTKKTPPGKEE
jgi:DNA-damage-inducible protein D